MGLTEYLSGAIERIVAQAVRQSLKNAYESAFLIKLGAHQKAAAAKRSAAESAGRHIPPFLIASIASECNLHCSGCYAWESGFCSNKKSTGELSAAEWGRVFKEAAELGVSFILLAGGEPLLRRDVLKEAARFPAIAFPVFTNGTLFDHDALRLFGMHRNLIPVISLEGDARATDARRGDGISDTLHGVMKNFLKNKILFGVSVTVTSRNMESVLGDAFLNGLQNTGCGIILFVEYVPVDSAYAAQAFTERERSLFEGRLESLRVQYRDLLFISFPGDEKAMGGCLAAGRGFFHINPQGGAEPCPFSPYSDINVRGHSLLEVIDSPLFKKLAEGGYLNEEHIGGCTLFRQKREVERLLGQDV